MIPARMTCPSGWTREYYGYLMSEHYDKGHFRTEFICFDRNSEGIPGSEEDENGSTVYPVEAACQTVGQTGGLPCNIYSEGYELTCAVCTK